MNLFTRLCDHYLTESLALERAALDCEGGNSSAVDEEVFGALDDLSQRQAADLLEAIPRCGGQREATSLLHQHALHQRVILQSAVLRHALAKPRGYAGDMDLMLMICQRDDGGGGTAFGRLLNRVYLQVPAAQAVRDRVSMLGRVLDELPRGSRVLNLACGPALEVQDHFTRHPDSALTVDLIDHDPQTLSYLRGRVPADRVTTWQANAFRILAGDLRLTPRPLRRARSGDSPLQRQQPRLTNGYDLIYCAGLYDYLPDTTSRAPGVAELTSVLFALLNPRGQLLVGNFLQPSETSRHRPHHRAMMELYSKWHLKYRTIDEIGHFDRAIHHPHTVDVIDENGKPLYHDDASVVGFALIRAT